MKTTLSTRLNDFRREFRSLMVVPEIKAFLLTTILQSAAMGWTFGTYTIFLRSHGLSYLQMNLVNTFFMVGSFLLDPPTGWLGDRFGQRRIYFVGQIAWASAHFFYGFGTSFWAFVACELLAAVGHALMSQALESWLQNRLHNEVLVRRATGFSGGIQSLFAIPSGILGGIVASQLGLSWPWWLSGLQGFAFALIGAKFLFALGPDLACSVRPSIRRSMNLSLSHPALRFSLLASAVFAFASQPLNMYWGPIINNLSGGRIWWIGFLWIGFSTLIAAGSFWGGRQPNGQGIWRSALAVALPVLIASMVPRLWSVVVGFTLHEFGRGAVKPILSVYAQRHIPDEIRSTTSSIRSAVGTLGSALGLIFFGWLTGFMTPLQTWTISAGLLIIFAFWVKFSTRH